MLRQIVFTKAGSNTLTGNFEPGFVARVPARLAAHLVEDAEVARYDEPPLPARTTREVPDTLTGRTKRRRNEKH